MKLNLATTVVRVIGCREFFRKKTAALILVIAVIVGLACIPLVTRTGASERSASVAYRTAFEPIESSTPTAAATEVLVQSQQNETLTVKLVTVTPRGFEPEELRASRSRFILMIDDLSGLPEISVQLSRVVSGSHTRLHEVRIPRGRRNWSKPFELTPGDYVLTESGHPNWVCNITVVPH